MLLILFLRREVREGCDTADAQDAMMYLKKIFVVKFCQHKRTCRKMQVT